MYKKRGVRHRCHRPWKPHVAAGWHVFSKILTCFVSNSWSEFRSLIRCVQGHREDARHRIYLSISRSSLSISQSLLWCYLVTRQSLLNAFGLPITISVCSSYPLSYVNNELCACFDLCNLNTSSILGSSLRWQRRDTKIVYSVKAR